MQRSRLLHRAAASRLNEYPGAVDPKSAEQRQAAPPGCDADVQEQRPLHRAVPWPANAVGAH